MAPRGTNPGVDWVMLPAALQQRLERAGVDRARLPSWIAETRARHAARIREGDEDHLVFYALQSARLTTLPPIEPAVSARALVRALDDDTRTRFLADPMALAPARAPRDALARLRALVRAVERPADDPRLRYFRDVLLASVPGQPGEAAWRDTADAYVARAYFRAMRFLDAQDRAAREPAGGAEAVAALYRTRGLSTDTSVEAGFIVHMALATLRALEPARKVRHVVIVGPGLDLAPRTGLVDAVPPQSVQPFAIVDSLLSLGLADVSALRVTSLDINPRVVSWLTEARTSALSLTLASGVARSETVQPSEDYRQYAGALGRSIGMSTDAGARGDDQARASRRVSVRADVTAMLDARRFDVVTDRIDLGADLGIVTNLLPYFDDPELTLALASISAMLGPGGILIHNEARGAVGEITTALGLPLVQSRTAIIAAVRGSAPLYDSVFVHRRN